LERLRHIREQRGFSQQDLADESGVSQHTISEIELGRRKPQGRTLRKLAKVLNVQVPDLYQEVEHPLGEAPGSPAFQPPLNGFEDARLADWRAAVRNARRLRENGRARMEELLAAWGSSKERGEAYDERRRYLDEMGALLQVAYDAVRVLFKVAAEPRFVDKFREVQEADRFYFDLRDQVERAELSITERSEAAAAAEVNRELPRFVVAEDEAA
jgi:transcriptional regulator with XRE-family HTH domain